MTGGLYGSEQNASAGGSERFAGQKPAYFRIPAHRFSRGVNPGFLEAAGEKMFSCDLTEAEGLDDLHHPAGAILEAEQLAAELYGSRRCWFLVNGTTCGNEAMILSAVGPGEKIMVPRNAHKSAMMGLILSGAVPVWIMPEYCGEWGRFRGDPPGNSGGRLPPGAGLPRSISRQPHLLRHLQRYTGDCRHLSRPRSNAPGRRGPWGPSVFFRAVSLRSSAAGGGSVCPEHPQNRGKPDPELAAPSAGKPGRSGAGG